jgi:hypothetical protein
MRLTPGIGAMLSGLTEGLKQTCGMPHNEAHQAAIDLMDEGGALVAGMRALRREGFEAGASPALSVVLVELQESPPGAYQEGLARAVTLLSQELGQHYGSVFEAGVRTGRKQAEDAARDGGDGSPDARR